MSDKRAELLQMVEAFDHDIDSVKKDHKKYKKWYRGNFDDIELKMEGVKPYKVNMVALVAKSMLSHLFFKHPTVTVSDVPGRVEALANVETRVLNDIFNTTNLWIQGRRAFLDAFLGPFGVLKVGYSADITIDPDLVEEERKKAYNENMRAYAGMRLRITKRDDDAIHLETHEPFLEAVTKGEFELDHQSVQRLRRHIEKHKEAQQGKGDRRTTESLRGESVFIERVKPDLFRYDLWAKDWDQISWVNEGRLMLVDDIRDNPDYGSFGKRIKGVANDEIAKFLGISQIPDEGGRPRLPVYMHTDLRKGEITEFVKGTGWEDPIRVRPYHMQRWFPSSSYIPFSYTLDPDFLYGIPEPKHWEDQQEVLNVLHTIIVEASKRSVPILGVNKDKVDEDVVQALKKGAIAMFVALKDFDEGDDISKHMKLFPTPDVAPQVFHAVQKAEELVAKLSGMGTTRLAGGDISKTATASAMIDQAIGALTESNAVVVDWVMMRCATYTLRLVRGLYDVSTVARAGGDEARQVWPEVWTDAQILDDRGITLDIGTMRRQSSELKLKMMTDIYAASANDPFLPPKARMGLLNYILRLAGTNVDLTPFIRQASEQPEPMPGSEQQEGGAGGTEDIIQGLMNQMGGGSRTQTGEGG